MRFTTFYLPIIAVTALIFLTGMSSYWLIPIALILTADIALRVKRSLRWA